MINTIIWINHKGQTLETQMSGESKEDILEKARIQEAVFGPEEWKDECLLDLNDALISYLQHYKLGDISDAGPNYKIKEIRL